MPSLNGSPTLSDRSPAATSVPVQRFKQCLSPMDRGIRSPSEIKGHMASCCRRSLVLWGHCPPSHTNHGLTIGRHKRNRHVAAMYVVVREDRDGLVNDNRSWARLGNQDPSWGSFLSPSHTFWEDSRDPSWGSFLSPNHPSWGDSLSINSHPGVCVYSTYPQESHQTPARQCALDR